MLGPVVNGIVIIICALVGRFLVKGLPQRFEEIIKKALGLSIMYIGIAGAMENQRVMLLIISLVMGSIIGEWINIDKGMNRIGIWAEKKMGFGEGNFAKGFVTASILFCTGSMAIVGAMQSGLQGNHEMLFAKSILDGVISIVFASTMGIGVAFSAVPVFLYEGAIALGAGFIKDMLTTEIITEMSAVGSLLIAALGFNFLEIKEIKVANMIPAIFLPWLFLAIEAAFL
ncbi:DUF554 domain-containing protein [Sinanaerobacter chloroacetimidivorans]|jgi:uncharacterized membrane protein YqgA involved in biofilm formation|uniref:DUF554 domain-containing protein n=1 Tax=Sinanaerobacter chloroacetimidivorans TaxID=2818044 RepID=A0A8J7W2H6_9FIRM|nr:DUF554 domain-containing protein [Sinanaerobacter chloroacetimidivorans]MBR0598065.1 DUF554 domain-containing protein [Sinanaerobacter chloroacetimidivorans]